MELKQIQVKDLGHLGVVASFLKKMNVPDTIDDVMPKTSNNSGISHGKIASALVLNGLGFVERRLYMVSKFFDNLPIERLLGDGIKSTDLNDDQIGRTLDAIYDTGVTELFFHIAMEVSRKFKMFNPFAHLDSTTFSSHGKHKTDENENLFTYGHSKDHRSDLKQITVNMGVSGRGSLPFWVETLPGNSSDMTSFHDSINKFETLQKEFGKEMAPIWVADSALYTAKRLLQKDFKFFWITRVPERIKEAKKILEMSDKKIKWTPFKPGQKYTAFNSEYNNVKQRWIMVYSEEAYEREIYTFEKNIKKEEDSLWKKIKNLKSEIFFTEREAEDYYRQLKKSTKYYTFASKKIVAVYKNIKGKTATGRRRKKIKGYQLKLIICRNSSVIQKKKNTKGRYIVATNFLNKEVLSDEKVLQEYKNQGKIERGFRFIKDKSFLVSDLYVKKTSRIHALVFIMALSLLVHNFSEYWIRKKLIENKKTVPNQVNKPTSNPTIKWIFQLMRGIAVLSCRIGHKIIEKVANITSVHKLILDCIGPEALDIYGYT